MADGWHWAGAAIAGVLLFILVLLWYDTLRERPGLSTAQATKRALPAFVVVPVGFALALLLPLWVAGVLIVVPLVVLVVMALAD